ncbi:FG-GAP-like repeat-containing protein [Streptomyces sp. NPDC014894]|uniref:FG-GAP-like repeat-containing protein n=1 Tax=unclassified Streptomyces TaxID=2593676 RepID=UPI0036FDDB88
MNSRRVSRGLKLVALAVAGTLTAPAAFADTGDPGPVGRIAAETRAPEPTEDFDGDGYQDLAVAAPLATVDGKKRAGYVSVLYGSPSGLRLESKQIIHQDTPGIPGRAGAGDAYGTALAAADLNEDRYADLVVGSPNEDANADGTLSVIWGGPDGLAGGAILLDGSERRSGSHIVTGDFDGDGGSDVATTGHGDELWLLSGPFGREGSPTRTSRVPNQRDERMVELAAGDLNRDGITDIAGLQGYGEQTTPELMHWKGTRQGLASPAYVSGFGRTTVRGESLDIGDVNKDGFEDIVVGHTRAYAHEPALPTGGKITYVPGSAGGPAGAKARDLHQDAAGMPGGAGPLDAFGTAVSIGDADGDGYGDVMVGATGKDAPDQERSGAVLALRGTAGGPTGEGARTFFQGNAGVPGTAEPADGFGAATKLVDSNGDGLSELAATAPGENSFNGAVWVFTSTADGVSAEGAFAYGPVTLGTVPAGGRFGLAYPN